MKLIIICFFIIFYSAFAKNVDLKDKYNNTELHYAVSKCDINKTIELIKKGAEVNLLGGDNFSPLHKVIKECDDEDKALKIIDILLKNKINPNLKDLYNREALHYACEKGIKACKKLIPISDVNNKDISGKTPLMNVSNPDLIKFFINNGADINAQDKLANTSLHVYVNKECLECVKIILDHNPKLNLQDKYGRTPLHVAAKYGLIEIAEALLVNDIDINIKDNEGFLAYDYADIKNSKIILRPLYLNNDTKIKEKRNKIKALLKNKNFK
ncbi:MAG: ankyrin repeat domain-containing protein [Sphingobacteriia bacterium]|nr:ankyrin repeat domain-containing protein [Sphingobacteriia bacterium]